MMGKKLGYLILGIIVSISLACFLIREIQISFSQNILISGRESEVFRFLSEPTFPHHIHSMSQVKVVSYMPKHRRFIDVKSHVTQTLPYMGNRTYDHHLLIDHGDFRMESDQELMGWIRVNTIWKVKTAKNQTRSQAEKDINPVTYLNETTVLTVPWILADFVERYQRENYWEILQTTKEILEGKATPNPRLPRLGVNRETQGVKPPPGKILPVVLPAS